MSSATQADAEKEVFGNFVRSMTERLGGTYAASVVVSAIENVRAKAGMAFHRANFVQEGESLTFYCGHCGKALPTKEHPQVWERMLPRVQEWLKKEGLLDKAGGGDGAAETFWKFREVAASRRLLLGKAYLYCDGCKMTPEQQAALDARLAEMQEAAERIMAQNRRVVKEIEEAKKKSEAV